MIDRYRLELSRPKFAAALAALALSLAACAPSLAQMHKVEKPQTVVRAVGVYEWTGDFAKPTASRFVPISLFIDNTLVDAGVYLARPVPLALLTGNLYELERAGVPHGNIELLYARHVEPYEDATSGYDDGWFGYGKILPPAKPRQLAALSAARTSGIIGSDIDVDNSRPHFSARSAIPGTGGAAQPEPGTQNGTQTASSSGNPPADPDRPTLHRSSDTTADSGNPPDDPDRPTLRRRTPEESKKARKQSQDQAGVTGIGNSLNDDPNRPILAPGRPASMPSLADFSKLAGLPSDLHQMVAVSDATDRPTHDFARPWESDNEHQAILEAMQTAARAQLAAYAAANPVPTAEITPDTAPATTQFPAHKPTRLRHTVPPLPPAPAPVVLLDEQLKGYTLSYGGDATYVYSARTVGLGDSLVYVTLVAQIDMQGKPQIALTNVTDADHLDRTPHMRFIDVVDADASNRASLLFELRSQHQRQFALYRVIGAHATQTILTGSTQ